jgi:hypothetical protein
VSTNLRTLTDSIGKNAIGVGESPGKGRFQVFDSNSANNNQTRWWISSTPTPNSGLLGMRMERRFADNLPLGLTLYQDGSPIWDTIALDSSTTDLVLAFSHATGSDMLRLRQDTGQAVFGRTVGQPSGLGPQFTIQGGDANVNAIDVLSVTSFDKDKWGLRLARGDDTTSSKRVRMILFDSNSPGWQVGTDSLNSGATCDFWIWNATTSQFPVRIGTDDMVYLGSPLAGSRVAMVGRLGGQDSLTQPFRIHRTTATMPSDANYSLTAAEAAGFLVRILSSGSLTATRNIVLPLVDGGYYNVWNNTTGAQSLQFIGASGLGVTVANGKRAILYTNGTDWLRITPDT